MQTGQYTTRDAESMLKAKATVGLCSGANEVVPCGEISLELGRLFDMVGKLEHALSCHSERIDSVLINVPVGAGCDAEKRANINTPLANNIREISDRINGCAIGLASLTNRVQL